MFEKDAEEIANKKLCAERICYYHCNFNSPKHHRCGEWHRCYEIAKDGAEFGYNKANEELKQAKKILEKWLFFNGFNSALKKETEDFLGKKTEEIGIPEGVR